MALLRKYVQEQQESIDTRIHAVFAEHCRGAAPTARGRLTAMPAKLLQRLRKAVWAAHDENCEAWSSPPTLTKQELLTVLVADYMGTEVDPLDLEEPGQRLDDAVRAFTKRRASSPRSDAT